MSIYSKVSRDQRGALVAALVAGSLVMALQPHSYAQVVGQPVIGITSPITIGPVQMVTISGHVPDLVKQSTLVGALPSDQTLSFAISLPLRNRAALADLVHALNDPSDARYNQYLTPTQFGAQFGPTQAQYDTLIAYLQSKGLTVTQTWPARTYLSLSGTTSQINSAFGLTLKQFRSPEGRIFHAPDTEVRVPFTVAGMIAGVVGLDDANPPIPLRHTLRPAAAPAFRAIGHSEAAPSPNVQNPGEQGTGPGGGFAPSDFRTAYGLSTTTLNGAGQTAAIIEYGTTFNIKDTVKYEEAFGLPRAPLSVITVPNDGTPTSFSGADETDLDIDMQLSMAPGVSILLFLQGNAGSNTDAINAVYNDGRAKQLSISYGFGAESGASVTPSATQLALNTAYTQLAAAGVSVYVSAGDDGSTDSRRGTSVSVDIANSAPMVCSVGGTALTVQSPGSNENYLAESTWNYNGTPSGGAGGGGVSKQWTIAGNSTYPGATYQASAAAFASAISGSNVSAAMRNVPDISCDASPETGAAIYLSGQPGDANGWHIFGGTSESAPLWAGYTALINQNRALNGLPGTLGLPQNSLYPLAYTPTGLTSSYAALFHDIADGSSNNTVSGGTNYAAVTGYDCSTGLGTMQGVNLIAALSGPVTH